MTTLEIILVVTLAVTTALAVALYAVYQRLRAAKKIINQLRERAQGAEETARLWALDAQWRSYAKDRARRLGYDNVEALFDEHERLTKRDQPKA